ncbi:hypothetical protein [Mycolicibacterium fortuitum]|nr:hypothetical protein [Mycolicibacterium fortuitum]
MSSTTPAPNAHSRPVGPRVHAGNAGSCPPAPALSALKQSDRLRVIDLGDIDTARLRIPGASAGFDDNLYRWTNTIAQAVSTRTRPPLGAEEVANAAIAFSFCAGIGLSVIHTATGDELIKGMRIRGLSLRTLTLAKAKIASACGGDHLTAVQAARIVDTCARQVGVAVIISSLRIRPRMLATANDYATPLNDTQPERLTS